MYTYIFVYVGSKFSFKHISLNFYPLILHDIHLYYKSQMTNKHNIEDKELNKIVHRDDHHHDESKKVELRIFYNNRKVKSLFIKNNNNKPVEDFNVVYQFNCDKAPCNEAQTCYIGHTTTTIKERTKQHSSIKKHYKERHNCSITGSQILPITSKYLPNYPEKQI